MTLSMALGLFCYGLILLFGVGLTAAFTIGPEQSRRHFPALLAFSALAILVQIFSWRMFGIERTKQLYPLIIHFPLALLMVVGFKRSWLQAVAGICSAYLCLQIPRWVALVVQAACQSQMAYFISYIPAIFLIYYVLRRYASGPAYRLTVQSSKACLFLGAVPVFYYLFDYSTTIYTKWLYTGAVVAVQFIPSVVAMFYFVFVVVYYEETQKQTAAQREREQMEAQFKQARTELDTLRQSQEQMRRYRHDIRHHITLLQALAAEGNVEQITEYLRTTQDDLNAFTPVRYCENETVNLILSSFAVKAKQAGVELNVIATLPEALPVSETELCSLLSNSLENAVKAASETLQDDKKTVTLRAAVYHGNLLLSVENPYAGKVVLEHGMPVSNQEGHGYGTRNIIAIAETYGGQVLFSAQDGVFTVKIMLPLSKKKQSIR